MSEAQVHGLSGPEVERVLVPGRNCCAIAQAHNAALLVDGADYFAALEKALRGARRTVFVVAWDFDSRVQLRPQDGKETPALGAFLRNLVEERPELEIRILVWSFAAVHAPGAALPLLIGEEWQMHPRIRLCLDTHHPIHAAHHQKIVTIDDSIAFVGGMDLTVGRWDTPEHKADQPLRSASDGAPYPPMHDLQMAVDGPAARVIARVARERWRDATGEDVPLGASSRRWPAGLTAHFKEVPVGIARTAPRLNGSMVVEEIAALTDDMLRSAKDTVYIEAQYFAARRLRPILRELLSKPDGPEIVVIGPLNANGVIERFIMGANRDRLFRSLKDADRYGRLRLYYPVVPGSGGSDCPVMVHAKLMIVDDRILRVGSANLNNRSVGLDTECDLVIEAEEPGMRETIKSLRDKLLAEHLGIDPALVRAAIKREGSLIRALERLNRKEGRCLRPKAVGRGSVRSFPGTRFMDPERPFRLVEWARWRWRMVAGYEAASPESRDSSISEAPSKILPIRSGNRK
ncbi:phospholipase D-like domain-containing protein [Chelativorans sp. Marseille-P2723]|uniref:phospholipase D-like domain-containing protein n=1 Tax=Chelativorans sp. Marseille-P2723 TaxID=2709133 RepID=UPI001570CFC9|nr:phospholipase D-like domain-containing protein [Chelativorans sp. Marseille-P2723]